MHCYRGDTEVAYLLVIEKLCARGHSAALGAQPIKATAAERSLKSIWFQSYGACVASARSLAYELWCELKRSGLASANCEREEHSCFSSMI